MSKDKDTSKLRGGKAKPSAARRGEDKRAKVVRIDQWRNRSRGEIAAPVERQKLRREEIPFLPRVQKEAFLLKYILCDGTTDKELDELLLSAATQG
jgi:hypothetical protein